MAVGCICTVICSASPSLSALKSVVGVSCPSQVSDTVVTKVATDTLSHHDALSQDSISKVAEHASVADSITSDKIVGLPDKGVSDSASIAALKADSAYVTGEVINTERWIPDPKRAMWYAVVFPGGGQIYNRKYWKLPIIYGAFVGCAYALSWNNTMYRDYSQAYIDIMDDDPNTNSYENFLPPSFDIDSNMERLKTLFQNKKNYYRRYRDLSIFCMIGVYLLSIIDAYVDAELSSFDISQDLSMKVQPAVINDNQKFNNVRSLSSNSYGIQCSLNF